MPKIRSLAAGVVGLFSLSTVVTLTGLALLWAGLAAVHPALAPIVVGALLVTLGLLAALPGGKR